MARPCRRAHNEPPIRRRDEQRERAQADVLGDADAVLAAGPAPVAQLEVGELGPGSAGGRVGGERGDAVPVDVGDGQLRAGVGSFLAHDHAHALGPVRQLEQVGEFGGRVNPTEYDSRWEVIQARTAWVDPAPSIRINTLRPALVPGVWPGSWARAALDHRQVVGGGVRPGVARAEHHRERFPGPGGPVVDEGEQRVEAKATLEIGSGLLFVGVGRDQRRVQVHDQRVLRIGAVASEATRP